MDWLANRHHGGGGGLMQMVAYGAQNVYEVGNPRIEFFRVVYRRHTTFATDPAEPPNLQQQTPVMNGRNPNRYNPVVTARLRRFCQGIRRLQIQQQISRIGRNRLIAKELAMHCKN